MSKQERTALREISRLIGMAIRDRRNAVISDDEMEAFLLSLRKTLDLMAKRKG